jgi:hypothetical protein
MNAELDLPQGSHAFRSFGYSLGIVGEDMKLTLSDEAKSQTVRVLFSRHELIELIRPLISGNIIELDELT